MARLEELARNYDERIATVERKRMMQHSYNIREGHKSFSAFAEDAPLMACMQTRERIAVDHLKVDPDAAKLTDFKQWKRWAAVPLGLRGRTIRIGVVNPRDGFLIAEVEKVLGLKVKAEAVLDIQVVMEALDAYFGLPR